jgi:transposase-like protein
MNRKPHPQNPPCPRHGATHGIQNGSQGGRPRWVCRNGGRSFGPTLGTAMDRWRATPTEAARPLRVGMRRGSRSAAEAITGHPVGTIRRWRRAAARHAEALTEVRVHDRHRSEVEVDAFGSFVKELISKFSGRSGSLRGGRRPGRWTAAFRAERSTFRTPLSATRRTAPHCFEPSDRPSDARTLAFPLGSASPAADSSECPPESPAVATPPESPSHHPPHPHIPPSAASAPAPSRSSSPASPPAPPPTDGDRAHS